VSCKYFILGSIKSTAISSRQKGTLMENQVNVGIQRQFYEPFEASDPGTGNSSANASLADDSAGAQHSDNPNIVAPHLEGESVNPTPPETMATNNTLNRYGIGDTIIMGRPSYTMPDYNPAGNTTTAPNLQHDENPSARHDATSWMKEASISGSNDSGGSIDGGGYDGDYGGGDYGGGGDVGGGGDGGSGPAGGGEDSGGGVNDSGGGTVDQHGSGDFDGGGDSYSGDNEADSANQPVSTNVNQNSNCVATYPTSVDANGQSVARMDTIQVLTSRSTNDGAASNTNIGSHGGSLNDYLGVDNYGVGSGTANESTNNDSTQSTTGNAGGYQNALDAASQLLGKPQGTVSYDDVLGALTQIRGASQNPELTMREQQALNSMFMAVYTRGNTERVIGPTVTNEFLNAAITSMMFGGGMARTPRPTSPTGPMLPGTTGNRTAVTLPSNRASETASLLAAAQQPFRGQTLTNAGRAATKHPEYFGFESTERMRAAYRSDAQINALANQSLQEILSNGIRTTGAGGRYPNGWVTYTLPDGRAASWQSSGEFIGFRGVSK
jgi:hypothetical protein